MNRQTLHAAVLAATLGSAMVAQAPPPVRDIDQRPDGNFAGVETSTLSVASSGSTIYWTGSHPRFGREVVVSDGVTIGLLGGIELAVGDNSNYAPNPRELTIDATGKLFFRAYNGATGSELYVWNGIQTLLVADQRPGNPLGSQLNDPGPKNLFAWGNQVYYTFDDGTSGWEIYRSDGSTIQLIDELDPGAGDGVYPDQFSWVDGGPGTLYFGTWIPSTVDTSGWPPVFTSAIYKTTGFPGLNTTVDIDPAATANLYNPAVTDFALYGSNLMMQGETDSLAIPGSIGVDSGRELLQFNGTNVVLAADINPGSGDSSCQYFTNAAGKLYMYADDGIIGRELFLWDGATATGIDLNTAGNSFPGGFFAHNNLCFFGADVNTQATGDIDTELCIHDGNPLNFPTTVNLQQNVNATAGDGSGMSISQQSANFVVIDATRVAFVARTGTSKQKTSGGGPAPGDHPTGVGTELFESDGTIANTILAADVGVGFTANVPGGWAGDDFNETWNSGLNRVLASNPATRTVYFAADDNGTNPNNAYFPEDVSTELWRYDANPVAGTAGTHNLVDDWNRPDPSYTAGSGVNGGFHDTGMGYALFGARDDVVLQPDSFGNTGINMYRYDEATNTIAGPFASVVTSGQAVQSLAVSSFDRGATTTAGKTFYQGNNNFSRKQLWVTNGNPAVAPTEIVTNTAGSTVQGLSNNPYIQRYKGGMVMYTGRPFGTTDTLCMSDGITGWAVAPGKITSKPQDLTYYNNLMYFTVGQQKGDLWASDGTDPGTVPVASFVSIAEFTFIDGKLYLSADDGLGDGGQLWSMDPDGTNVQQLTSQTLAEPCFGWQCQSPVIESGVEPRGICKVGSVIVFMGKDNQFNDNDLDGLYDPTAGDTAISVGYQPWKSNGAPAGTSVVETWDPQGPSFFQGFSNAVVAQIELGLVMAYDTSLYGREPHINTGFPGGSGLIKDIVAGVDDGNMDRIYPAGGRFATFAYGQTTVTGSELYATNGTAAGTFLANSVNPGNGDSNPFAIMNVDGAVIYQASNYQYNSEVFAWNGGLASSKSIGISSTPAASPALELKTQDGIMGAVRTLTVSGLPPQLTFVLSTWSLAVGQPELVLSAGFHHVYIDAIWFSLNQSPIGYDGVANPTYTGAYIWPVSPALIGFDVIVQSFVRDDAAPKKTSATNGYTINWGLN